jgi:hypothetical protein
MHAAAEAGNSKAWAPRAGSVSGTAPALGAHALLVAVLLLAMSASGLSAAAPAGAGGPPGAPVAPVAALPVLLAVAGDVGTGVAVGDGALWWAAPPQSAPAHRTWYAAAGADTALVYTAVVKAGTRYLAVAEDGSAWISADAEGKVFSRRATAAPRPLRALARLGGVLVAVGDGGTIRRCADLNGVTWTSPVSPVSANLRGIAWNGVNTVVAVGDGGTVLHAGVGGTDWQVVTIAETHDLLAVTADPPPGTAGRFLAVSRDGAVWRGEGDGATWTRVAGFPPAALRGAAFLDPAAVVVGDAGSIRLSPGNLEIWDPVESPVAKDLRAVCFTGIDLLAVGAGGTILWSSTGSVWHPAEFVVPTTETSWGRVKGLFRR